MMIDSWTLKASELKFKGSERRMHVGNTDTTQRPKNGSVEFRKQLTKSQLPLLLLLLALVSLTSPPLSF